MTGQITSSITSDAPFVVSSTQRVANLNADMLDGYHSTNFQRSMVQANKTHDGFLTASSFGTFSNK